MGSDEIAVGDKSDPLRLSEFFCARADKHDMWSALHDQAGEGDGMSDMLDCGNRACLQGLTVHDGSVELGDAFRIYHCAATGVELAAGIVLEGAQRCFDGIDGGSTLF